MKAADMEIGIGVRHITHKQRDIAQKQHFQKECRQRNQRYSYNRYKQGVFIPPKFPPALLREDG